MSWSRRQIGAGLLGLAAGGAGCASLGEGGGRAHSRLVFLGQAKVFAIDPDGGPPAILVDDAPKDGSRPTGINDGIAVHPATGQIYWSNMGRPSEDDGYVMRCDPDGRNVAMIVPAGGTFTPKQLKIDEAQGKLYWSDREGMRLQRCNLDGSQIETIVTTGDPVGNKGDQGRWCVGVALDPGRGHVYWTQKGGDGAGVGSIRRAGLRMPPGATAANRPDIETLFANLPEPIDLDLDLSRRVIYWTDRGDNTLSRAPMDPAAGADPARRSDREILVRGLKEAIGVAIDPPRNRMAYTSLGGEVGIANLDGSEARLLATGLGLLTGVAWA